MVRRTHFALALILAGAISSASLLPACSTTVRRLPAISESEQRLPGKIIWHDLLTHDIDAASRFYSELFGWKFQKLHSRYGQFKNGENLVGGVAEVNPKELGAYWVPLMSVTEVDQSCKQVESGGGKILKDAFDIPGRGRVAVVADSQGAPFGFVTTLKGDPLDREAAIGDWLWNEAWTENPDQAATFYKALGGYKEGKRKLAGKDYRYLESEGKPRVGLPEKPDRAQRNAWVSYVRVADPAAVAERAAKLGGKILLAPTKEIRTGSVAVLSDPTGGVFLVQKWPIE